MMRRKEYLTNDVVALRMVQAILFLVLIGCVAYLSC
jgi:hypothetical protein